jgi:hypothetical protein
MHKGRFPACYVLPGRTGGTRSARHIGVQLLDDLPIATGTAGGLGTTRRSWLLGVGAVLCTSAMATVAVFGNRKPTKIQTPQRGTLAWALAMGDATDAQLVLASGDLEMVSAQHRTEECLVPVFIRLLDVTLDRDLDLEHADVAGACAVRSLARLGHPQAALRRQGAITSNASRPETHLALDGVRRRFRSDHNGPGRHR